jgi:hypothetical protein
VTGARSTVQPTANTQSVDRSASSPRPRRAIRQTPPSVISTAYAWTEGRPCLAYHNHSIQQPNLPEDVPPDLLARPSEDASRVWVASQAVILVPWGEPEPPARPRSQSKRNEAATEASRVRATSFTRPSSTRIRGRSRRRVPGRLQASSSLVSGSSPRPRLQAAGRNPARASGILTRGGREVRLEEHRPLCPSA